MDRHHRIVIPYIDVDEDRVRCNLANFIEAGSLAQFMKRLHEDLTVTLNQKVIISITLPLIVDFQTLEHKDFDCHEITISGII